MCIRRVSDVENYTREQHEIKHTHAGIFGWHQSGLKAKPIQKCYRTIIFVSFIRPFDCYGVYLHCVHKCEINRQRSQAPPRAASLVALIW